MSSKQDFQASAEKMFGIWQKQMSDAAKDPDMMSKSMELFYTMQKNCMTAFNSNSSGNSDEASSGNTTSAVNAHDDAARDESGKRIEELEKRVAILESMLLKFITTSEVS